MKRILPGFILKACLAAIAGLGMIGAQAGGVLPRTPVAGEPFFLYTMLCMGSGPFGADDTPRVEVQGSTVAMVAHISGASFSVPFCSLITAISPQGIPAGRYNAVAQWTEGSFRKPDSLELGSFEVAARQGTGLPRYRGLSGNWFESGRPGSGLNFVQGESGALFAAWLTYRGVGESRHPRWLVMSAGQWITPDTFRGFFYETGASAPEQAWVQKNLRVNVIGLATITFASETEAKFEGELLDRYEPTRIVQQLTKFRF